MKLVGRTPLLLGIRAIIIGTEKLHLYLDDKMKFNLPKAPVFQKVKTFLKEL
jgi:hypothetical protein